MAALDTHTDWSWSPEATPRSDFEVAQMRMKSQEWADMAQVSVETARMMEAETGEIATSERQNAAREMAMSEAFLLTAIAGEAWAKVARGVA